MFVIGSLDTRADGAAAKLCASLYSLAARRRGTQHLPTDPLASDVAVFVTSRPRLAVREITRRVLFDGGRRSRRSEAIMLRKMLELIPSAQSAEIIRYAWEAGGRTILGRPSALSLTWHA